jgi:hypothetical protein
MYVWAIQEVCDAMNGKSRLGEGGRFGRVTKGRHLLTLGAGGLAYHGSGFFGLTLNRRNRNQQRMLGALACLLAIATLYAPLAAAAFSPSAMACCTGGFCNIPKHHHKSKAAANPDSTATHEAGHEDCGHDSSGKVAGKMPEMNDCSMDCCQTHETPAVSSVTFVMPPVFFLPASMDVTRSDESVRAIEIPRAIEPASPPPRFLSNIL